MKRLIFIISLFALSFSAYSQVATTIGTVVPIEIVPNNVLTNTVIFPRGTFDGKKEWVTFLNPDGATGTVQVNTKGSSFTGSYAIPAGKLLILEVKDGQTVYYKLSDTSGKLVVAF